MSMVVVHVASGTRNVLVFLGRMAEAMGHALQLMSSLRYSEIFAFRDEIVRTNVGKWLPARFLPLQRPQRRVDKDSDGGRQIHADVAAVAAKLGRNRADVPISR